MLYIVISQLKIFIMSYKEDFNTVYLEQNIKEGEFDCYKAISNLMELNGYNVKNCDICSVNREWSLEEVDVKFKFVHYSIPTMATEPFYHVRFKEA